MELPRTAKKTKNPYSAWQLLVFSRGREAAGGRTCIGKCVSSFFSVRRLHRDTRLHTRHVRMPHTQLSPAGAWGVAGLARTPNAFVRVSRLGRVNVASPRSVHRYLHLFEPLHVFAFHILNLVL